MKPPRLFLTLRNLWKSDTGRRHPVRVALRFLALQLRRRCLPRPFVFDTVTGTRARIERTGDFSGITGLYYQQPRFRGLLRRPLTARREGRQDTIYARVDEALKSCLAQAAPVLCMGDRY